MSFMSASTGLHDRLVMPEFPDLTAPLTLAWSAVLLLAPLLAAIALRAPLNSQCDSRVEKSRSRSTTDYWAFRGVVALMHPGYRASLLVLVYAALLALLCGAVVWREGGTDYVDGARVLVVNVTPGLPAAAAGLLAPAIVLFVAGVAVSVGGQKWSLALCTTPLLLTLWLGGLALGGCIAALIMPSMWVAGVAVATTCGSAGAIALFAPSEEGIAWMRIAHAMEAGRSEFAAQALKSGRASGEYRAPGTRGVARWFQSWFFVPATVLEYISWDESGIEVGRLNGNSQRYTWEDIVAVKVTEHIEGRIGAEVRMRDGKEIDVPAGGPGYRDLVSAIQARLWEREREER